MIILRNIKVPFDADKSELKNKIAKLIERDDFEYKIYKKSIDARKGIFYVYQVLVDVDVPKKIFKKLKNDIAIYEEEKIDIKNKNNIKDVVIVGTGPAGMFAGYALIKSGVKVTFIERGKRVEDRIKDIDDIKRTGKFSEESNVQFGEGGAGTFSDGKLTSRSKDKRSSFIFDILVQHGADEEILYEQKPHIGTDVLRKIIIDMRKEMESLGAVYKFEEKFIDFEVNDGEVKTLITDKDKYKADKYILALGNSARDTFIVLDSHGLVSQKPFAVGFRIEHLRKDIENAQYGINSDKLPSATYQLNYTDKNKDYSVYTFCMCPGGYVINSSSRAGKLCVNGMSYHARDGINSNSAVVATVDNKIFGDESLDGMYFQEFIEKRAFELGGGRGLAPVQKVIDYINGNVTTEIGKVKPTFKPGYVFADLNKIYPDSINDAIKTALKYMDKKVHGFASDDAILTGVETRTSSPIRIDRKDYRSLKYNNLYPIGEGAGYSGGIISSALDGLKCAIEILERWCEIMKKNFWEIVIYYVVGLIYPIAYFLLMSEYFHRSVFDGAISILTIYILICYVLYPFSSKIVSDKTADKKSSIFLDSKSVLFFDRVRIIV